MKQILQSLKTGVTEVVDVPCPQVGRGNLLVRTSTSLVSAGTERMLLEFGKAGFVNKARQQPDKVKQVVDKMRTDGVGPTVNAVFNQLDQPMPLGYCNVGELIEMGADVSGFEIGERIVSNGKHAEMVSVPLNLCAKVPDAVSDEEAAFTVIGAIAMQGVRLAQPSIGECVVVTGLGLVGLVTVQLLVANGCRVLGLDFDKSRQEMARSFGAETFDLSSGADPINAAMEFSRGNGADAVIVTAASKSSGPVNQAAQMSRKRGRVIMVGTTGLDLVREEYFKKELMFQVSCSYGPGRYDLNYEEKGQDYPIGYVRWTEQRNFEAVLDLMAAGKIDMKPLISHRFTIDEASKAYEIVGGSQPSLGILFDYPRDETDGGKSSLEKTVKLVDPVALSTQSTQGKPVLGFIGSGNYATSVLIPAFKAAGGILKTVASSGGVSGVHAGKKFEFAETTTDTDSVFADTSIDTIVITTRHNSHANLVCKALQAGKHVFVEKPLALTHEDLDRIDSERKRAIKDGVVPMVMVGFNRRFSPLVKTMKETLASVSGPKSMVMTVNAGDIPGDSWIQDPEVGGRRIIGEACHFVDLLRHVSGSPIVDASIQAMDSQFGDTATIQLSFEDGSIGTVHYFANGSKSFPKERLEVFVDGKILQLDNFRKLSGYGWSKFRTKRLMRQDKGQNNCSAAFLNAVELGAAAPIAFEELMEVSRTVIDLASDV